MTSSSENWFNSKDSSYRLVVFLSHSLSLSVYFFLISTLSCSRPFLFLSYFTLLAIRYSSRFHLIHHRHVLSTSPLLSVLWWTRRESLWPCQMSRNGIDASLFFFFFTEIPGSIGQKNITRRCVEQQWWGNRDGKCTFRRSTRHAMPGRNEKLHRNGRHETNSIPGSILRTIWTFISMPDMTERD